MRRGKTGESSARLSDRIIDVDGDVVDNVRQRHHPQHPRRSFHSLSAGSAPTPTSRDRAISPSRAQICFSHPAEPSSKVHMPEREHLDTTNSDSLDRWNSAKSSFDRKGSRGKKDSDAGVPT